MRVTSLAALCVATVLMLSSSSVTRVSASACYISLAGFGWDHELRMGVDIMATALNIAQDADFRIVQTAFDDGAGQRTSIARVGAMMARCWTEGKKVLIDFHSTDDNRDFMRAAVANAWTVLRTAIRPLTQALGNGESVARHKLNVMSCFPDDLTVAAVLAQYTAHVVVDDGPTQAARRAEYATWLFGARGVGHTLNQPALENAILQATNNLGAHQRAALQRVEQRRVFAEYQAQQRAAEEMAAKMKSEQSAHSGPASAAAKKPAAKAAPAPRDAPRTLQQDQEREVQLQGLLATATHDRDAARTTLTQAVELSIAYAPGQRPGTIAQASSGWVLDSLAILPAAPAIVVVDAPPRQAVPMILIAPPFNRNPGGQRWHNQAKEACYEVYPDNAQTLGAAFTASACVRNVVFHVSSDGGERGANPVPTLPVGAAAVDAVADTPMAARPVLMALRDAFPDLGAGEVRAIPAGADPRIGKKGLTQHVVTTNAHRDAGFDVMPGALLNVRAHALRTARHRSVQRKLQAQKLAASAALNDLDATVAEDEEDESADEADADAEDEEVDTEIDAEADE